MSEQGVLTFPLPHEGVVVIGRGDQVDIRIEDPSISRRHATLHIGSTLKITDLGSSNGTHVCDVALRPDEPAEVHLGDVLELGLVFCTVRGPAGAERPRRLRPHSYFEVRLEDACAAAAETRAGFAVLRVRADPDADPSPLEMRLLTSARAPDVVASYAPGEYEVLLAHATASEAELFAAELVGALPEGTARVGVAVHPRDGRSPEQLLARACAVLHPAAADEALPGDFVVADPAIRRLHALLERIARGTINVLLLGETGAGKEVFAARLHACSPRAEKPFVKFNCAAFTDTLVESELFGYEKGAFTGATSAKLGLLESAAGGTVFLDEVGELSMAIQAKLLRVLEERVVRRVGALQERSIDVRIVAATNRDLEAEGRAGRFREDLYFRLNGFSLVIPPLRQRLAEIVPLARRFVAMAARQEGRTVPPAIAPAAVAMLERYGWPGNVRELRNVMERAVLLCDGDEITPEHLPVEKLGSVTVTRATAPARAGGPGPALPPDEAAERERILAALEQCFWNQSQAARALGITRRVLIARIEKYDLPRPRKG